MNSLRSVFFVRIQLTTPKYNLKTPLLLQTRGSQYPTYYVEPTYKPEDLATLAVKEIDDNRAFIPVKAARTDQNTCFYHDPFINKFINLVMRKGKKDLARSLVEKAFENVKSMQIEKYNKTEDETKNTIECNPVKIFYDAITNCKPVLGLTPIKRGGIVYQVPVPISDKRSLFLAMKWLIEAAKDKQRKIHFPEKLAWELIDAAKNQGRVVKRKQELHKQCEANKAFAHYRWG